MHRYGIFAATLWVAIIVNAPESYASGDSARVTYLKGTAELLREAAKYRVEDGYQARAPWRPLSAGGTVAQGDAIRVKQGRLELSLPDGSRIRLDARTVLMLRQGSFRKGGARTVSLRLWAGRVWAKVAKRLGGRSTFEVRTANAVAGVRGTSFTVVAKADLSSVVKVYAGSVGVLRAGPAMVPARRQISPPERVDRAQWEEVIASAMQQVRITQLGEIRPAEDFLDAGPDLEWAQWNQGRDRR